jgi:hypothetical protein
MKCGEGIKRLGNHWVNGRGLCCTQKRPRARRIPAMGEALRYFWWTHFRRGDSRRGAETQRLRAKQSVEKPLERKCLKRRSNCVGGSLGLSASAGESPQKKWEEKMNSPPISESSRTARLSSRRWKRLNAYFFLAAFLAGAAFFAGAAFLAAGFLAASFLTGAFLAGAFFTGIKNPPFHPQLRRVRKR